MFFTFGIYFFTSEHVLSRMVTPSHALHELFYILAFFLDTVTMTLVDAT
jgi:hypothetical protein